MNGLQRPTVKLLLTCILLTSLYSATAGEFQPVKANGIEGAIIPAETPKEWLATIHRNFGRSAKISRMLGIDADGFWTPDSKDIEAVESHLLPALKKWKQNPLLIEPSAEDLPLRQKLLTAKIGEIIGRYGKYRRQYIGLLIGGRRHIYLNSFPSEPGSPYTKQLLGASDGGSRYWYIVYSVEDAKFDHLWINGHG